MSSEFRYRASLFLNAVLAVMIVLALSVASPAIKKVSDKVPVSVSHPKLSRYADATSASDKRRWVVDQLRAMGVPNEVLARMVELNLDESCDERASEVWDQCNVDHDTMDALQLEFDVNRDAEMRAALGEEGFKQWDHGNMMREANGGKVPLTPSETDAVYNLWKKLQQRQLELKLAKSNGEMDDKQAEEAWEKADAEYKQQMKALLGEERYTKAEQMDEGTAEASLKRDFAKANPSDTQFQGLLKAQQQWKEQRAELDKKFQDDTSSPAYADQVKALDEAREQEYRSVLGNDVFDTLQKQQDQTYTQMKKYESIWGLDDSKVDAVYATMKYYQKSAQDYQAQARAAEAQGQNVDWDEVNKNLQQFSQQTQETLQKYLGQDSFTKLQQNGIFQFNQSPLPGGKPF